MTIQFISGTVISNNTKMVDESATKGSAALKGQVMDDAVSKMPANKGKLEDLPPGLEKFIRVGGSAIFQKNELQNLLKPQAEKFSQLENFDPNGKAPKIDIGESNKGIGLDKEKLMEYHNNQFDFDIKKFSPASFDSNNVPSTKAPSTNVPSTKVPSIKVPTTNTENLQKTGPNPFSPPGATVQDNFDALRELDREISPSNLLRGMMGPGPAILDNSPAHLEMSRLKNSPIETFAVKNENTESKSPVMSEMLSVKPASIGDTPDSKSSNGMSINQTKQASTEDDFSAQLKKHREANPMTPDQRSDHLRQMALKDNTMAVDLSPSPNKGVY